MPLNMGQNAFSLGETHGGLLGPDLMRVKTACETINTYVCTELQCCCSTLNIWAPRKAENLPVMVWIFGAHFSN